MEANCDYKGNIQNGYPGVQSMELCQEICDHAPDCGYFNYNQENQNCDVYDITESVCRILIGPPSPFWDECKPGGNITTTIAPMPSTKNTQTTPTASTTSTVNTSAQTSSATKSPSGKTLLFIIYLIIKNQSQSTY